MKKRIVIEAAVGLLIAALFFYWLYLRPEDRPEILAFSSPQVAESIEKNQRKVTIIGVDGMDWDIALDLMNQGRMPFLASLYEKGAHGSLAGNHDLISPALWTSIFTGQPPSVHGIDNHSAKLPFEYREARMTGRFRRSPALWQMVDAAGKSAVTINVPAAVPAPSLERGVFIGADVLAGEPGDTYPEEWGERTRGAPLVRFMPYERLLPLVDDERVLSAYLGDLKVYSVAHEAARTMDPDLLAVVLPGIEAITTLFYEYRYPYSMDHYSRVADDDRDRYREVVETHYELVDRMIGGLLGESEGRLVMVISDHGFGPSFPPHNIMADLNRLLERLGHLAYDGPTCDQILTSMLDEGLEVKPPVSASIFTICQSLSEEAAKWKKDGSEMPAPAMEAYVSVFFELRDAVGEEEEQKRMRKMHDLTRVLNLGSERKEIRWDLTRAFNMRDFKKRERGIYINLAGRDPKGAVSEDEFKSYRRALIKELSSLRTDDGDYLFNSVRANKDKGINPMTRADQPDILVELNHEALVDDFIVRRYEDPDPIPLAAVRWIYSDVTALPEEGGMIIIAGPEAQTFGEIEAGYLDVTPTVLWALGMPLDEEMPGKVLGEAFPSIKNLSPLYIRSWRDVVAERQSPVP